MTDDLSTTMFRMQRAIEADRGKKRSRFRRLVGRAWDRAVVRGDERMADLLFRRMWPGVLPPREPRDTMEACQRPPC